MPRYLVRLVVELTGSEQQKGRKEAPAILRFMPCTNQSFSLEVSSINAEEAHRKAMRLAEKGTYDHLINGRPYSIPLLTEARRLADDVRDIRTDDDLHFLGYTCVGQSDEWERGWIWQHEDGHRILSGDSGNGHCTFLGKCQDRFTQQKNS